MASPIAVKLSSDLAEAARLEASEANRSMTGQIEHWAKLGRAAEAILPSQIAAALKRCAGDVRAIEDDAIRGKVLDALAAMETRIPESLRREIGLDRQTLFEPDAQNPGGFVRITPDGVRTRGAMDGRVFVPIDS